MALQVIPFLPLILGALKIASIGLIKIVFLYIGALCFPSWTFGFIAISLSKMRWRIVRAKHSLELLNDNQKASAEADHKTELADIKNREKYTGEISRKILFAVVGMFVSEMIESFAGLWKRFKEICGATTQWLNKMLGKKQEKK